MQTVRKPARVGPADWVTALRACLTVAFGGFALTDRLGARTHNVGLVCVVVVALLLDGVDGWVARRTGTQSARGARFDLEVDAALILLLSIAAMPRIGAWTLAIGAARYAFLGAQSVLPWLRGGVPPTLWRKSIAVLQAAVLIVDLASPFPLRVERIATALALMLLAVSFGTEARTLYRRRIVPGPAIADHAAVVLGKL